MTARVLIVSALLCASVMAILTACGDDSVDTSRDWSAPDTTPVTDGEESETPPAPIDINALLAQAATKIEQGQLLSAQEDYRAILEADRNNVDARLGLGMIFSMRTQYDEALEEFRHVIRLAPDNPMGYYERGKIFGVQLRYTLALRDFDKAIELDAEQAEFYNVRGFALLGQARAKARRAANESSPIEERQEASREAEELYVKADDDFTTAIELDETHSSAYVNRAFVRTLLGDDSSAMEDVAAAVALGQDQEAILTEIAAILEVR